MRLTSLPFTAFAAFAMTIVVVPDRLEAGDLFGILGWLTGKNVDVHPHTCHECGPEFCTERAPITKCVTGKKKVYDSKIFYEYVSIPETRYRWKKRFVTKEIPCDYCKPTCDTELVDHCFGAEKWTRDDLSCCSKLHCKSIVPVIEKLPCKHCGSAPGKTTIKVHYWDCVKEPYTVYRQVRRPICVKEPRYEKVCVPITKHVCLHCNGQGCSHCGN